MAILSKFVSWLCGDQLRALTQRMDAPHVPTSRYPPRTIVCPVSLRPESGHSAIQIAYMLAQRHGAELTLLHGYEPGTEIESARSVQQRLSALQARLSGVVTRTMSVWGDPASAIIRATAESDLLVMRRSQSKWLVGRLVDSLSQRVCRLAHCPVMFVHQKSDSRQAALDVRPASGSRDVVLAGASPRLLPVRRKAAVPC